MKSVFCRTILFSLLLAFTSSMSYGQGWNSTAMKQFMELRFGMFIHWGPVTLRGTEIGWSRTTQVDSVQYDSLYKEFNPVLFNADQWVKAAKEAGMKYLTITARHHDGFCLWPTKYTYYNIMNSPYKKDIIGELSKACKKQGIKFCIYYSILDWWHPDYPMHTPDSKIPDPKANMPRYVQYMKNQLKELIENYDPYVLWFDGYWESPWTLDMSKDLYAYLKKLKPTLIINNRIGKERTGTILKENNISKLVGDFDTPEQVVGRINMNIPWESCFTLCNQWAWKPNDKMKTLASCLRIISQTAGGNGNLLLNVGPMMDGRIEARQVTRLKEIGNWMRVNGQAVYNTLGGPYILNGTYASTRKGNIIFIHVIKSDTTALSLTKFSNLKINKAYVLGGSAVEFTNGESKYELVLPAAIYGKNEYVIALEMDGNTEKLDVTE